MKKFSKILSVALLVALVLSLGVANAFAATVEIKDGGSVYDETTKVFKAYEVFSADWEGGVITNVTNGNGVSWSAEMLAALNGIDGISNVTDAKTLAAALDGASVATGEAVAKVLKNYTVADNGVTVKNGDTLNDGYYIIVDETVLGENDVANAALLQVAGDKVTINVKTSKTIVEKKIDGDNDNDSATTGLVDANNGQVGDLVPYVITATVPNTYYYEHYYMELNDTVSAGLDISAKDATGDAAFSNYKVYQGDAEMDASKYVLTVDPTARTIKVEFTDVKGLDGTVLKLTYSAKINDKAVVGTTGNPNEVTLKYSNNPDHSGEGEYKDYTTETPKDIVVTYLTGIKLLKVDAADNTKVLEGAVFQITGTREVSTIVTTHGFTADATGTYYKLKDGSYTETAPGGAIANDKYDSTETKYVKSDVTEVKTETADVKVQGTTGADGYLKFNDLGAGTYTITEITAPTGYNLLTAPITVVVEFTGPNSVSDGTEKCVWTTTTTGATFDAAEGVIQLTIQNGSGATLPSTGGIGTTIFYVVGGVLVLAAIILLVTKKRMSE